MDAKPEVGGKNLGPTPKEFLLASICGCSGMDVASILGKMRLNIVSCQVNAQTETTAGYPAIFTTVHLQFVVESPDAKSEQVIKAATLSMTKYCGVSAMVVKASPIRYDVVLNGTTVFSGDADFTGTAE
ncbi:MAG: OsmC family protein [Bdellovibrio sp.]|nr:OsmC family protein [Bdellovibrio sp.]